MVYNDIKHLGEKVVGIVDTNRMKKAAEWFYGNVFRDEAIRPRAAQPAEKLPSLLRTARSLENGMNWQSRESVFLKQAKLLAGYEDDSVYNEPVLRYFPTYQSLTNQELRGYFGWRSRLRRGDVQKTSLSFAFLYIYELLNLIGTADPMEGYRKLTAFRDSYGQLDSSILPYLEEWVPDFVVYYGLDANLLADTPRVVYDRSITILDNIHEQDPQKVMYAVRQLAPKWLGRSKFYGTHQEDMDTVTVRVLRRVCAHYAARCKNTMVEQYFGKLRQFQVQLFESAVFCDQLKRRSCEYVLDERCVYRCQHGLWTVQMHGEVQRSCPKLEELLKTIDSVLREEFGYRHPVKCTLETKWILKIIREEAQALLAEKKAAEAKKITIDYSRLAKIRRDAAVTQEKLTVEEELEEEVPEDPAPPEQEEAPSFLPPEPAGDSPLSPAEYRLLQCLLYGRDYGWVQAEGHMLSVLSDGINEKLYDVFLDSVMDDTPELVPDYIDELKEMVKP